MVYALLENRYDKLGAIKIPGISVRLVCLQPKFLGKLKMLTRSLPAFETQQRD